MNWVNLRSDHSELDPFSQLCLYKRASKSFQQCNKTKWKLNRRKNVWCVFARSVHSTKPRKVGRRKKNVAKILKPINSERVCLFTFPLGFSLFAICGENRHKSRCFELKTIPLPLRISSLYLRLDLLFNLDCAWFGSFLLDFARIECYFYFSYGNGCKT